MALALAGCSAARPLPATWLPPADLPAPTRSEGSVTIDAPEPGRVAVESLVVALRGAIGARDAGALRGLLAPVLGGIDRPAFAMSREAWLQHLDALHAGADALDAMPALTAHAQCAPRCRPGVLLEPGEWLVAWPRGAGVARPRGAPTDRVVPWMLRVSVRDGVAVVTGLDDDIVAALGPRPAVSGGARP